MSNQIWRQEEGEEGYQETPKEEIDDGNKCKSVSLSGSPDEAKECVKETTITEVDDTERRVGEGEQNQEKEKTSGDNAEKLVQASDRFLENCKTVFH